MVHNVLCMSLKPHECNPGWRRVNLFFGPNFDKKRGVGANDSNPCPRYCEASALTIKRFCCPSRARNLTCIYINKMCLLLLPWPHSCQLPRFQQDTHNIWALSCIPPDELLKHHSCKKICLLSK